MAHSLRALKIRGVSPRVLYVCLLLASSACVVSAQSLGTVAIQPAPASDRIFSADGSGPARVAVGWAGAACVSEDGAGWNHVDTGVTAALRAVVRTPAGFLAAGDAGTILTSSNGTAWTKRTSGIGSPLYCASSGGGLQLVGGGRGTGSDKCRWDCMDPALHGHDCRGDRAGLRKWHARGGLRIRRNLLVSRRRDMGQTNLPGNRRAFAGCIFGRPICCGRRARRGSFIGRRHWVDPPQTFWRIQAAGGSGGFGRVDGGW